MSNPSDSFCVARRRTQPYIQPSFTKMEFQGERPAVVLISAVGATGKTTLARVLSSETGLPLLDLGTHKPVGDNTLTGLLTTAFHVSELSHIFEAVGNGTYGIIIDGVDEGRAKTTDKAFEAFLDDIARLCADAAHTSFVLLGRTEILAECWLYLSYKGISTGLVSIDAFGVQGAREYVDAFTDGLTSSHRKEYEEVRDSILTLLGRAFGENPDNEEESFLSFIGYPPVLDAIVTLLNREPNYHRIQNELEGQSTNNVEIGLLYRISSYILRRERDQKLLPAILEPLIAGMPPQLKDRIRGEVFSDLEQCTRLVAYALGRQLALHLISEDPVNEKYEAALVTWLPEHPFLSGRRFRNAVFESVALATLIASNRPGLIQLALEYVDSNKHSYHLIYFLDQIASGQDIPITCLRAIIGSAMEFRSTTTSIELRVDGSRADDLETSHYGDTVETEIEIISDNDREQSKTYRFQSNLGDVTTVALGRRLSAAYIELPIEVTLAGSHDIELTAPVELSATKITISAPTLILRPAVPAGEHDHVLFEADKIESMAGTIAENGVDLTLSTPDGSRLTYPAVQYFRRTDGLPMDPQLREKYLRLKRILIHFRSHSKGALAKYRHKIEHERVIRNQMGWAILRRLLQDEVLTLSGRFYFLQPDNVDRLLGVSYDDLRKGRSSEKMLQYLRSIG